MAIKTKSLLLIIFISISISLSTARILPGQFLTKMDDVIITGDLSHVSKSVVGCGGEEMTTKTERSSYTPEVVAGKFGTLVLNALPKGNRPASGPSKKSNDVKT
ncbi:unnamed protein product [Cochlearia groenlandica]